MQNIHSFGQSIRQFKSESGRPVFQQAQNYPAFFEKHLLHPARRIKVLLNDPNANIKAFYLQYLMLCFEIENQNYQFYISKIQKFLLDPNFNFLFLEEDDDKIFNDRQFKRFMLEFMDILDSGEFQSTEAALNAFPIADVVFVYFFRSLAIYANITNDYDSYIDKTILFGFLLQNFSIDAQMYEQKCIKFIQAQLFVFQQSPQQIYIVYKDTESTLTTSKGSQSLHNNSASMTSSKKQDNQQVQQNISMLEQQQQNLVENNQNNNEAFRKKMIENNNNNIAKFKSQLEQQPSVFSRNQDQVDSQLQLQESFKKSLVQLSGLNKAQQNLFNPLEQQVPQYIFKHNHKKSQSHNRLKQQPQNTQSQIIMKVQQNKKQQEQVQNKIQKSISQGQKSQMSTQKQKYTIPQTTCTNDHQYNISINQPILKQYRLYQNNPHMQKSNSQINLDEKKYSSMNSNSKYNTNFDQGYNYHNQYGIANRQRASISQTDPNHKASMPSLHVGIGVDPIPRKQPNSHTDILAKITQINSRFNSSIKNHPEMLVHNTLPYQNYNYPHFQYKSNYSNSITSSPIKQVTRSQSNNYLNNLNQLPSITYIPATRDVPISNYHQPTSKRSIYEEDFRAGLNTGFTPLKEYPKQTRQYNPFNYAGSAKEKQINNFNNGQVKNTIEYQSYIYPTDKYSPKVKQFYNNKIQKTTEVSTLTKFSKETYSPFSNVPNAKQTIKVEVPYRDLRQESISNKDKWRQLIMGKLSVSKQFTDSLTLMKIGQPYNSNIKKMKARSREFRQSIINCLK